MSDRSANPWEMNRRILADRAIDAGQKCLLLVIVDLAGHGRRPCTASYQRLADGAGMTRRNAIGVVKKLRDGGYIAVHDARAGSSGGIRIQLGASLLDPAFLPPNGEAHFTTNGEAHFTTNGEAERTAMVKSSVGNGEAERTAMVKPASPKRLNTGAAEPSSSNVAPRSDDGDESPTLEGRGMTEIPPATLRVVSEALGSEVAGEASASAVQLEAACRGRWEFLEAAARATSAKGRAVNNPFGLMLRKAEEFAAAGRFPDQYRDPEESLFRSRIEAWIQDGLRKGNKHDVIREKVLAKVEADGLADGLGVDVRSRRRKWAVRELAYLDALDECENPGNPLALGNCLPRLAPLPPQGASA